MGEMQVIQIPAWMALLLVAAIPAGIGIGAWLGGWLTRRRDDSRWQRERERDELRRQREREREDLRWLHEREREELHTRIRYTLGIEGPGALPTLDTTALPLQQHWADR